MHFPTAGFDRKDVAVQFHVSTHLFVVDVVNESGRNFRSFFGEFLGVIGQRGIAAAVTILGCVDGVVQNSDIVHLSLPLGLK